MKSNDFLCNKAAEAKQGECVVAMNTEDPLKPHSNYWEMFCALQKTSSTHSPNMWNMK